MSTGSEIYAGLTSFWPFDGDMLDAHGTNDIAANLTVSGYEAGKTGQQLSKDSRGSVALASSIAITTSAGKISMGAWLSYDGVATGPYIGGLARHLAATTQEVLTLLNATGKFMVFGWKDAGFTTYEIIQPTVRTTPYPITVRVTDSVGSTASSNQIIRITETGTSPAGTYFVVVTYDDGVLKLYVDALLVGTLTVTAIYTSPIAYFQVGSVGYGLSACGWEDAMLASAMVWSQTHIDWLYNLGAGRTYADLVAA